MSLAPGTNFGHYRIIEPLGKGGMASVYKAYEAGLDRYVALKVLPGEYLHDQDFSERFNREARLIAKLEHPNIIPIYNYGIDEPTRTPWIALRLIAGGALSSLMRQGRMPHRRVVEVLHGSASALDYAHSRGVIHRDVKPQNILLDEAGRVYLADFGIARMLEGSAALTQAGMITGTPQYMAPEQATGQTLDNRADIYALGVVAYEMLTGHVPFSADTPIAVLMKHVQEPMPLPNPADVPEAMVRALLKAMAKDRAERWETAVQFAEAMALGLEQAGVPETAALPPPAPVEPVTARSAVPATMPGAPRTARGPRVPPPPPAGAIAHQTAVAEPARSRIWLFAGLGVAALVVVVAALGLLLFVGLSSQPSPPDVEASPLAVPTPTVAELTPPSLAIEPRGEEAPGAIEEPQVAPADDDDDPADEPEPPRVARVTPPTAMPATPRPVVVPPPSDDDDPPPSTATGVLRLDVDAQQATYGDTVDVLFVQVLVDGRPLRTLTVVFSGRDAFQRSRKRETFEIPGVPVGSRSVTLVASPDRNMAASVARGAAELEIEEGVNRAYAQVRFLGGDPEVRLR